MSGIWSGALLENLTENYFIITFVPFLDEVGDGSIQSLFFGNEISATEASMV